MRSFTKVAALAIASFAMLGVTSQALSAG